MEVNSVLPLVFEQYKFKDWLITITGDDELTGFATQIKYASLLNKDNYHYIDEIAEKNNIKTLINECGDKYYKDFDYIIADPNDVVVYHFEEINTKEASCVLDYMVKEILRYITPQTDIERIMSSRGIQRFNDTKMVVLKQIKKISIAKKITRSSLHNCWSRMVRHRDKKCTECNSFNDLHAHHIKAYKDFKELRYDVNNGITLCGKCHRKHHKIVLVCDCEAHTFYEWEKDENKCNQCNKPIT